eukprot:1153281-Pelagomonas_calceolata.AAC.3
MRDEAITTTLERMRMRVCIQASRRGCIRLLQKAVLSQAHCCCNPRHSSTHLEAATLTAARGARVGRAGRATVRERDTHRWEGLRKSES